MNPSNADTDERLGISLSFIIYHSNCPSSCPVHTTVQYVPIFRVWDVWHVHDYVLVIAKYRLLKYEGNYDYI